MRFLALLAALPLLGAVTLGQPAARAAEPTPVAGTGPAYDGRFDFVRIRYTPTQGGAEFNGYGREPYWAHDLGRNAEGHLATILDEITFIHPQLDGKVLTLDDPDLGRYPIAYIIEVGYWRPTDAEVEGLRNYLRKGGFLIVDDFRGTTILNFEAQMQRVLPGARMLPVESSHGIWDAFFYIKDPLALAPPPIYGSRDVPEYLGYFENNDARDRLMVIVNHNQDLSEYWEYSATGFFPVDPTNEAYKFGVNYMVYAMTH